VARILGIETSCDETSASVLSGSGDDVKLESLVILSQDIHKVFGGVVPEIASRAHLTSIVPVVNRALSDAGSSLDDIDAIAVTAAPGLIGALLVGVCYAKSLAFARDIPVIGVHHMEGHLFATALEHPDAWGRYRLLGATRDDAAGEAFDKVAKLLGLPYPGGRHIEALAREGDPSRFRFSRPMVKRSDTRASDDYYQFSFSGLKTAILNAVRDSADLERDKRDIARGFQDALIGSLVEKTYRAADAFARTRVVLGGGVACNKTLADAMRERMSEIGATVFAPSPRLATDNAAMIARAGLFHFERGERSDLDLNAFASQPIPGLIAA
jgi:N6-L-threonylcarbamoyladenine synthase